VISCDFLFRPSRGSSLFDHDLSHFEQNVLSAGGGVSHGGAAEEPQDISALDLNIFP
jgi:hypothetical protein